MAWLEWFGDDRWTRPRPTLSHADLLVATLVTALVIGCHVLVRSFADIPHAHPLWADALALTALFPLFLLRRQWPLAAAVLAFCHFFALTTWLPETNQLTYQVAVFALLYSGVAHGRDRRATGMVMGLLTVGMLVWVAWTFAVGRGVEQFRAMAGQSRGHGPLPAVTAWVLFSFVVNGAFMAGSIAMGQAAWRQARGREVLARQAEMIRVQAEELRDQAVVDERLRIARELHDVVAHHVSVMGIQAAGARRLLERDPTRAAEALQHVEESARQAVTQMRSLLGALRAGEGTPDSRDPQPTLVELGALLDEVRANGLAVDEHVVESHPGATSELPLPVQLSLYRTVQEALANVRRHSTAASASVTVRADVDASGTGWAEAEVLDDGRPRGGTSGSGLGLLGMRERVTTHGGTSEIGPRVTGGYRVRVRLPVGRTAPTTTPEDR